VQEENALLLLSIVAKLTRSMRSFERKDFLKVKRKFLKVSTDSVKFEVAQSNLPLSKLGITVSRKFGNAVSRNRFKRHVREAFRSRLTLFPTGTLIHALAKSPQSATFNQISSDFDELIANFMAHGSQSPAPSGAQ